MDKTFLSVLIERFKSENLEFFNKIIKYAVVIAGIGGALIALPEFTSLPGYVQTIGTIIVSIAAGVVSASNMTTKNTALRAESEKVAKE